MITGSMTGREMYDVFLKDRHTLEKFACDKARRLNRELRRGLGEYTTQCYDYKTKDLTEYKVCVYVNRSNIKAFYADMFIYCKETNDYYCAGILNDERGNMEQFTYTTHFLHRYAERALGIPDMPLNRILAHIEREIAYTVIIYKDKQSKVLATTMGLFLQRVDERRGVNICKTFISIEMMKTSQIKAYEVVADLIKKYSEKFTLVHPHEDLKIRFSMDCLAKGITELDLINAYGEYFKKKKKN